MKYMFRVMKKAVMKQIYPKWLNSYMSKYGSFRAGQRGWPVVG